MQYISNEQLAAEWQSLLQRFSRQAGIELKAVAEANSQELAAHFYQQMLADPQAALFLSHEQVQERLSNSMQRWVQRVLTATSDENLEPLIELQRTIGEVHARIEIPVSLVLRGARHLKGRLRTLIEQRVPEEVLRRDAARLGADIIDLAVEIICFAYSQSHDRNSRAEEAYRLFSVAQNLGAEKERQRAALLDWENQLMFNLAVGSSFSSLPRLTGSEFGLWFRHKAAHAFQGSPNAANILEFILNIDKELQLLGEVGVDQGNGTLHSIREKTRSIRFLLDNLFEQAGELETGRDVLTRLLNRKFLPVVMNKEMLYSRQSGGNFGVLAIDVDNFKQINDRYGHDGGDQVLLQIATALSNNTRGGDYAFRLGGEEFLLVLVDINAQKVLKAAEKLRDAIASERFRLPQGEILNVTVSIGVAVHDGHPDYEHLLRRADQALYEAKRTGRNRCVLAPSS
ncbi:diguanylate cyclase [Stutzerimonas stutzeri]|uniref:diguanylate cyclase n=1 Tax=Stutzerimonas stutzeri TaxID=316 RepID=UPI0015E2C794|nr:diguanylate cyclase [Stutzerimonas stutzeri]